MRAVLCLVFLATFAHGYRLPEDVIPVHYDLELITNLGDENDKYEFSGTVRIKVKCVHPTGNITLHAKNLRIDKGNVTLKEDGTNLRVQKVDCDSPNEFLIINLDDELQKDKIYELAISFHGELKDVLAGYYRSSYVVNNKTHYIATTQFESTDARRAFPCFDEPGMKATFTISMGHTKKYGAISNMPQVKIEDIKDKENWVWTRFDKSVPMSTYLVAFIVSDFSSETAPATKDSNVTFRIWSRKDAINQTHFAKDVGPKFLSYYEDFFDIKYPLPKQDMIAIPDFSAGAMENWGLVTYRESTLLYDPQHSTSSNQETVASVVAHELAHQWFGNLVTMKWWTDLWLNEGFATYMAALAVHHTFPHWNSLEEESAFNFISVLGFDSMKSSHPISAPIGHPSEIDQIFDTISYKKGSMILRMMSTFLSEETLRKGVSNYLNKHKYKNAEQDDLWESLTEQAHKDKKLPESLTVKKVMDTWTLQTGYPVITVDREYGKDGKGSVSVSQKRFLLDRSSEKPNEQCWWVPLSYTNQAESDFKTTSPKHWLPCKNEPEKLEINAKDDEWLLFNVQAAALVRVNYDVNNWKLLVNVLNSSEFEKFPVINRVQLLSDSAYLAWVGELPYKIFFGMFKYLAREDSYAPWNSGLNALNSVGKIIRRTESYGLYKKYVKHVFTPVYEKLNGLELSEETKKSLEAIKHQIQVIAMSCKYDAGNCVADANKKFVDYKKDPIQNDLQKDIKYSIICSALRHGSEDDWEFMWKQYLKSNVASEKSSILSNLGCTQEIWLLRRYLQWTLDPNSGIRKQDYNTVFSSVASGEIGYFIAQNFLEDNIQKIHDSLAPNTKRLGRYLAPLAMQMTTETEYYWFRNFTTNNAEVFKDSKQLVEQSIERIRLNLQWQERHGADIKKFFE